MRNQNIKKQKKGNHLTIHTKKKFLLSDVAPDKTQQIKPRDRN
jgi:hypothetical protein